MMAGALLACSIFLESVLSFGLISFLQGLGKGGKNFSLQMIHAPAVQTMGLGIFADRQSLRKSLIKIIGMVAQNCFQAVLHKEQVTLEFLEILS